VKEESLDGFAQGLQARRPWGGLQLRRRQEADGGRRLVDNAAEEDIRDRERRLIHTLIHGEVYTLLVPQLASRDGFSPTICETCKSSPTTYIPGDF
jgi:hypothetical protein